MAHYAEIDANNKVIRVLVTNNDWSEEKTLRFLKSISDNRWSQTSYHANIRGKFAGIGDIYDEVKDEFTTKEPEPVDLNKIKHE